MRPFDHERWTTTDHTIHGESWKTRYDESQLTISANSETTFIVAIQKTPHTKRLSSTPKLTGGVVTVRVECLVRIFCLRLLFLALSIRMQKVECPLFVLHVEPYGLVQEIV